MNVAVRPPTDRCRPIRRRWFQVSLRTFLVLMLLVSFGLAWLGIIVQRGREQRKAVQAIVASRGRVSYFEPSSFFQRSDWLRKSLGDEMLLDVAEVRLWPTKVSDADLVHLKGMTRLSRLFLKEQVTDAGLVHLKGLSELTWLYLDNTRVTNAGLVQLKGLSKLTWLNLNNTQVTDAGVRELQE